MEQLKQLEQNMVDAAVDKRMAVDAANEADESYLAKLNYLLETDIEFRELRDKQISAQVSASAAKSDYSDVKAQTVKALLELTDPDDFTDIDAFGYRMEKEITYRFSDYSTIKLLCSINAFGLLEINKKALEKYIKVNAEKYKDIYKLPEWLDKQLEQYFGVKTIIKPTISDAKITKLAK